MMKKSPETRFLSLLLALVLSFSLCGPALADFDPSDYSDVSEKHWAYDNIMYCSEWEIVKGFEDGTFRPEGQVTYAQFIAMLARTFYSDEVAAVTDTAGKPWYYPYMTVARDHDLDFKTNIVNLGGWPEVVVADDPVNRYEMASILRLTLMDYDKDPLAVQWKTVTGSIKDYDQIPEMDDAQIYWMAVPSCYYVGVLSGMSDGCFHGEEFMTRAQACVVVTRMINVINGETPGVPSTPQQPTQPETPPQPQQPEPPEQTGTGLLANGQPATVENVQAILDQIKQEYPEGTPWGAPGTANNNYYADGPRNGDTTRDIGAISVGDYNVVSLQYGCGGWMAMVSERIFGKTGAPCREVTDITKARPGDIVIKLGYGDNYTVTHVGIFLSYEPGDQWSTPSFLTCDGNNGGRRGNGTVLWGLRNSAGGLGTYYRIFTRYPEGTESETP